jgi:hypothetical protein
MAARILANFARHPSKAKTWTEVAQAWDDLANLKEQVSETAARIMTLNDDRC